MSNSQDQHSQKQRVIAPTKKRRLIILWDLDNTLVPWELIKTRVSREAFTRWYTFGQSVQNRFMNGVEFRNAQPFGEKICSLNDLNSTSVGVAALRFYNLTAAAAAARLDEESCVMGKAEGIRFPHLLFLKNDHNHNDEKEKDQQPVKDLDCNDPHITDSLPLHALHEEYASLMENDPEDTFHFVLNWVQLSKRLLSQCSSTSRSSGRRVAYRKEEDCLSSATGTSFEHYIVTSSRLPAALFKLAIHGLSLFIPIDNVVSLWGWVNGDKSVAFQRCLSQSGVVTQRDRSEGNVHVRVDGHARNDTQRYKNDRGFVRFMVCDKDKKEGGEKQAQGMLPVEVLVVGDGKPEEAAAELLGIPFFKIDKESDLEELEEYLSTIR